MKPVVFFNHIDRSLGLEEFIADSLYNLRLPSSKSRWVVSKEKNHFVVKCIIDNKLIEEKSEDVYLAVKSVIKHIKRINQKKAG